MHTSTLILGAGPGGTGLLVCAAQRGELSALLDRGLVVVERGERMGAGTLGRYDLNSDSLATSFVEFLESKPAGRLFGDVAQWPVTRELIRRRETHVPLSDVAEFLGGVGDALQRELERHPLSRFLAHTLARSVLLRGDGSAEVELCGADDGATRPSITADSVVLALGARQELEDVLTERVAGLDLARLADRIELTDPLLSRGGVERLRERIERGARRVVIVGGAHSAFSVAWMLTERLPAGLFEDGSVVLLHRSRLRIFYRTPQEALEDGYGEFTDDDICPRTGRVHRLGGLRGDGRALWRRATGRVAPGECRVRIEPIVGSDEGRRRARRLLEQADVVVPAFGYRPRVVPLLDEGRRRLRLLSDNGGPLVGADARVLLEDGRSLPGLFGIGMGSGFVPPGESSFHGQTNGVWLYHNVFGRRVLEGLGAR